MGVLYSSCRSYSDMIMKLQYTMHARRSRVTMKGYDGGFTAECCVGCCKTFFLFHHEFFL